MDIISKLPIEVATSIFRHLDDRSLYAALRVNGQWRHLICGDPIVRKTLVQYAWRVKFHDPRKRVTKKTTKTRNSQLKPQSDVGDDMKMDWEADEMPYEVEYYQRTDQIEVLHLSGGLKLNPYAILHLCEKMAAITIH